MHDEPDDGPHWFPRLLNVGLFALACLLAAALAWRGRAIMDYLARHL